MASLIGLLDIIDNLKGFSSIFLKWQIYSITSFFQIWLIMYEHSDFDMSK